MGLFNKIFAKKANTEEPGEPLVQIVLLKTNAFSFEKLIEDFEDEWCSSVKDHNISRDDSGDTIFTARISAMSVIIKQASMPVPQNEISELAKNNFNWREAAAVAQQHTAHLIVSVNRNRKSQGKAACLLAEVCTSILKQNNAIAVDTFYAVLAPEFYSDMAHLYIDEDEFPVLNYIFIGGYSPDNGTTHCGYTYGMNCFGKKEIEVLNSVHTGKEIFRLLTDAALYVLGNNVTLNDGETIGFSEDQCLQISESASDVLEGYTVKIEY